MNLLVCPAELHLYEGFIGRPEERSIWKAGLQFVGLNKPEAEEASEDWQRSAGHLLRRIFRKWSPSEKASTDALCQDLTHFRNSLGFADKRVVFSDKSQLPPIMVGEGIKNQNHGFFVPLPLASWFIKILFISRRPS